MTEDVTVTIAAAVGQLVSLLLPPTDRVDEGAP